MRKAILCTPFRSEERGYCKVSATDGKCGGSGFGRCIQYAGLSGLHPL